MSSFSDLQAQFERLFSILEELTGEHGCEWDRKQTLSSLRDNMIEEYHEYLEALDRGDKEGVCEELGDVALVLCFLLLLAERELAIPMEKPLTTIADKLVRRHPHVFKSQAALTEEELLQQWEAIKAEERKDKGESRSELERIPPSLAILQRAKKVAKLCRKKEVILPVAESQEETLGQELFQIVQKCEQAKISPESALRVYNAKIEENLKKEAGDCLKA